MCIVVVLCIIKYIACYFGKKHACYTVVFPIGLSLFPAICLNEKHFMKDGFGWYLARIVEYLAYLEFRILNRYDDCPQATYWDGDS